MLLWKISVSSLTILYPSSHDRITSKYAQKSSSAVQLFLSHMFQGNNAITSLEINVNVNKKIILKKT